MSTALSQAAPGPSRRTILLGLVGAAVLVTVTGCTSDEPPAGSGSGPGAAPDPDLALAATAVADKLTLVALYEASIARFGGLGGRLASLREDHSAHAQALATFAAPAPAESASPSPPAPAVPDDRDRALMALAGAETAAAGRRIGQCEAAGNPELARLIAAIGGSEAAHAAVLGAS